jgi:hypothetical protein
LNERFSAGQKDVKMSLLAEEKYMLALNWTELQQSSCFLALQNEVSRVSADTATQLLKL